MTTPEVHVPIIHAGICFLHSVAQDQVKTAEEALGEAEKKLAEAQARFDEIADVYGAFQRYAVLVPERVSLSAVLKVGQ